MAPSKGAAEPKDVELCDGVDLSRSSLLDELSQAPPGSAQQLGDEMTARRKRILFMACICILGEHQGASRTALEAPGTSCAPHARRATAAREKWVARPRIARAFGVLIAKIPA